jgi:AraC-like DNA-binding protein
MGFFVAEALLEPTGTPLPRADGPSPVGFRLARIGDLQELEAGAYWPRLQPHFRKPEYKQLRYRIQEGAASASVGKAVSIRGASGIGELDVAYIADRLAATMTIAGIGLPDYCLTAVSRGALEYSGPTHGTRAIDADTGLVYRGLPGTRLAAAGAHERLALWIPAASLNQRLSALLGGPVARDLVFEPVFDWNADQAPGLRRLLRLMVEELGTPAPFGGSEVATRSFTDLVLYTLLRAVPHNHSDRLAHGGGKVAPGIVRRAEAFIRANVEEPMTLQEVSDAAGCSVRTLQLGFQRFRETTPLLAIRLARLEAARAAIRAGGSGATVTDIALRFGFSNPGRFARLYKSAFGEFPVEAIRHRPKR